MPACIVFNTCPDENSASRISRTLVDEGLAACVTRLPGAVSVYSWRGKIVTEGEVQLLIKTTAARCSAVFARVRELHPYEEPELLALGVSAGEGSYLDWLCGACA